MVDKVYTQMNDGYARILGLLEFANRVSKGREEDKNILQGLQFKSEQVIRTFFPDSSMRDSREMITTLRNMIQNIAMQ